MKNWVKISRDLRKHWIFSDAEYLKWWLDIIFEAAWEDTKVLVGTRLVELKRGQLIASLSYLCNRWHRSRSKVEPFLNMLIEDGMITKQVAHNISIITVMNYNLYQDSSDADLDADLKARKSTTSSNNDTEADAHLCADLDAHPKRTKKQKADAHLCADILQSKSATCADSEADADAHLDAHLCADLDATINKEDKEIKKDIINNKLSEVEQQFEIFRKAYPGRKRGFSTELDAFKRKHKNWREIVPMLLPALQRLIAYTEAKKAAGEWTASYANLSTWLYQARWEEELPEVKQQAASTEQPKTASKADYDEDDSFNSKDI